MKNRIYLDHAATTPMLPEVVEAMVPFMIEEYGNPSSTHEEGRRAKAALEQARKNIAKQLGAKPGEIVFTSGGTESNHAVFYNAIHTLGIKRIISSPIEHHSVLRALDKAKKTVTIELVDIQSDGSIDLMHLESLLKKPERTLVSLMHANNEIGSMLPVKKVSHLVATHNAWFHTDAVQTVGHNHIDLEVMEDVHFLSSSAHKFHGPKGTGFLFIRKGVKSEAWIKGGAQEMDKRAGTENLAGIVGMSKALEIALTDLSKKQAHVLSLKQMLHRLLLEKFPGIQINGAFEGTSRELSLYSILNVTFPAHPIKDMLPFLLDLEGIAASAGSACESGAEKSHVLSALGVSSDLPSVRFSFSTLNTPEEIHKTIHAIERILEIE